MGGIAISPGERRDVQKFCLLDFLEEFMIRRDGPVSLDELCAVAATKCSCTRNYVARCLRQSSMVERAGNNFRLCALVDDPDYGEVTERDAQRCRSIGVPTLVEIAERAQEVRECGSRW